MGNVLDKLCRENDNTDFMFNNFFPKITPFMRQCRKIWWRVRGHMTSEYGAYALHAGLARLHARTRMHTPASPGTHTHALRTLTYEHTDQFSL